MATIDTVEGLPKLRLYHLLQLYAMLQQLLSKQMMQIQNSSWIDELRNTLKMTDCEADFMDMTKHFLLPLQIAVQT